MPVVFPLKVIGKVGLDAVKEQGGATWARAVQAAAQKAKDQKGADSISFNGAKPHKSHTDDTEAGKVISVQLQKNGKRVSSGHITEDGSIKYSK